MSLSVVVVKVIMAGGGGEPHFESPKCLKVGNLGGVRGPACVTNLTAMRSPDAKLVGYVLPNERCQLRAFCVCGRCV